MDNPEKTANKAGANLLRPILLIAVVVGVMFAAWYFDLGEQIGAVQEWIRTLGPWGPVVFVIIYAIAAVAALPGVVLTVGGGADCSALLSAP